MPRHKLTTEERSRGGLTRAAKMRAARELADERLSDLLEKALDRLALLLDSEDDMVAVRAAREVFDRVLANRRSATNTPGPWRSTLRRRAPRSTA
jgi:hypothetical protein